MYTYIYYTGTPFESGPAARLAGAEVVLGIDCRNFDEKDLQRDLCYDVVQLIMV